MAEIAFRLYIEEIDGMIDGSRAEEAIAHLKHILNIYPKNLQAYRLLAKALLEKNRHLDAADVFQRVLSSVPDDFVSHVGMAVVREDEGNVDAAIWHLERAFEVQPSSGPVTEELRRLYGKRDGVEPPRLRLSRAALARMYEKGDLYPQAIAELRAALVDDPERLDLKVLLASALWRSKQRSEAAETSAKLLQVLPYCKEANRIMASVWADSGRDKEAESYRRRLEALDPYEAFADPSHNGHGVMFVAPDSVKVPRLENVYRETTTEAQRPDWMEALGIQYDQAAEAAAAPQSADWLRSVTEPTEAEAAATAIPTAPTSSDWLSALRGDEAAPSTAAPGAPPEAAPDWLSGLGVTSDKEQSEPPLAAAPEEGADWLTDILGQAGAQAPAAPPPTQPSAAETGEIPRWMLEEDVSASRPATPSKSTPAGPGMAGWLEAIGETPTVAPAEPETSAEDDRPDWMKAAAPGTAEEAAATEETPGWMQAEETHAAPAAAENEIPDWLQAPAEATTMKPTADEVPDWLKVGREGSARTAAPEAEIPDWLAVESGATTTTPTADEMPAWLAGGAEETTSVASPEAQVPDWLKAGEAEAAAAPPASEVPDWVRASGESAAPAAPTKVRQEPPSRMQAAPPKVAAQAPSSELPEWLQAGEESAAPATPAEAEVPDWMKAHPDEQPAQAPQSEFPDWLKASDEVATTETPAQAEAPEWPPSSAPSTAVPAPEAELPDWLRPAVAPSLRSPTGRTGITDWLNKRKAAETGTEELSPEEEAGPPEPALPQLAPEDIPPWLEPSEATAEVKPGEIPDWLKPSEPGAIAPTGPEEIQPVTAFAEAGPISEEDKAVIMARAAQEIPDWMAEAGWVPRDPTKPLETPPSAEPEEVEPTPEPAELPEWLRAMKPPEEPRPVAKATGVAPDWLKEAMEGGNEAPAQQAELPEWLKTAATEPTDTVVSFLRDKPVPAVPEPQTTPAPSEMSADEALAWLESLAAKQGAQEDELVTKRSSEHPDWLRKPAEEKEPAPPTTPPAEPAEATLPDWLRASAQAEPSPSTTTTTPEWLRAPADEVAGSMTPATEDEALAWLESLAAKQGAKPEELVTRPATPEAEPPAWLRVPEEPATAPGLEAPATSTADALATQPVEMTPAEPSAPSDMSEDEALAWLESLAAKQGAKPEELVTKPEAHEVELPVWIHEEPSREPAETETAPSPVAADRLSAPEEAAAPSEAQPSAAVSADQALAWLESLAAKQGAKPDELVTKPEQRVEEMPEWIRKEEAAAGAEAEKPLTQAEAATPVESSPVVEPIAEKPEWLKEMEAEADAYEATLRSAALTTPAPAELEAEPAWEPKHVPPQPEPESARPELPAWLAAQPAEPEAEAPAWVPMSVAAAGPEPAPVESISQPEPTTKAVTQPKPAKTTKPPRQRKARASKLRKTEAPEIVLALARKHIAESKIDEAVEVYSELIASGGVLNDIIADIETASLQIPGHPELLRVLGDAYMRDNQLQKALDTYKKALRLV